MIKSEIRKYYLEKRKEIPLEEINRISAMTTALILTNFDVSDKLVHTFLSIPNQPEFNTTFLVDYCLKNEIQLATSLTHFKPKRLTHSRIDRKTTFSHDNYGVPVPSPVQEVNEQEIDLVIVPLLCCDEYGNRIGYGQGFYDSFLKNLRADAITVGVSLFDPIETELPKDPWDVSLDYVAGQFGLLKSSR